MRYFRELYKYFSDKRFSTIAGTLVYFLLMSVTPFLFWLALIAGNIDFSSLMSNEIFTAIAPVLNDLKTSAENATGSAGIILIATSLWSSTNFFYHLRRSGEIIYDKSVRRNSLRLRLASLLNVFVALLLIAAIAAVPILNYNVLDFIMPSYVANVISLLFMAMFALFTAYLLNLFASPYRLHFETVMPGSLLTTSLWMVCAMGFTVYLKFANPQRLYGAIAALIVFLLWCYVMINSLVIGIIYNSRCYNSERRVKLLSPATL